MNTRSLFAAMLACTLAACGGGDKPDDNGLIIEHLKNPVVTTVSPATATVGVQTIFTVNGTEMANGMQFVLANCAGAVELAGGTETSRRFSCTPGGAAGTKMGNIVASETSTFVLLTFQVNYQ